jgi:hypothetical protein
MDNNKTTNVDKKQNTSKHSTYVITRCPTCDVLLKTNLRTGEVTVIENKNPLNGCPQDRK